MKLETAQEMLNRLQMMVEEIEGELRKAGHLQTYDILAGSMQGIQDIIEESICDCDDIDEDDGDHGLP